MRPVATFCLLSSLLLIFWGCSTYKGHKISLEGTLPVKSTGIPFKLVRPEYTIKISPDPDDETKANYTLKAVYVPDASQQYTLTLDPSFFADGNFTLNLNASGMIEDSTATVSERVTPFITTIGTIAADLAGPLSIAFDKQTAVGALKNEIVVCKDSEWTAALIIDLVANRLRIGSK
jgi:hypothetical protein